jgi:hypothetical protein
MRIENIRFELIKLRSSLMWNEFCLIAFDYFDQKFCIDEFQLID